MLLGMLFSAFFAGMVLLGMLALGQSGSSISGMAGTFYRQIQAIGMLWYLGIFVAIVVGVMAFILATRRG